MRQRRGNYRVGLLVIGNAWFLLVVGIGLGLTEPSPEERCSLMMLCGLAWLAGHFVGRLLVLSYQRESMVLGPGRVVFHGMYRSTEVRLEDVQEIRWHGEYHPVSFKLTARPVRKLTLLKSFAKWDRLLLVQWIRNSVPTHKQTGWTPNFDAWLQGNPSLPKFCSFFSSSPSNETREQHWHYIRWLSVRTLLAAFLTGLIFGLCLEFLGDFVKPDLPRQTGVIVIDWTLYGLVAGIFVSVMFLVIGWNDEPEDDPEPTAPRRTPVR